MSPQPGLEPISLPGSSSFNGIALPSSGGIVSLPGPLTGQDEEDGSVEWYEVAGTDIAASASANGDGSIFGDGFGDAEEGVEINVDQFAAEMDQELLEGLEEEDGEGEVDDMFGDVEEPARELKPMSLNQFAGGGAVGVDDADEDFSSSSDESDDD